MDEALTKRTPEDWRHVAASAVIGKQDHPEHTDAWVFIWPPLPISAMGEHAASKAEAIEKVAKRLEHGAETGDYRAEEDRTADTQAGERK